MTTSIYAALLAGFFVYLSMNVIRARRSFKVAIGNGDNEQLSRKRRAHSNFSQYTPMFVILLFIAEYNGLPVLGVHILGVIFLLGRLMHAYSITVDEKYDGHKMVSGGRYRVRGMMCTFLVLITLSFILLTQSILEVIYV